MEQLLSYFETISSKHRGLILVSGIAFFFLLEYGIPLFRMQYKKFIHAWINIFFTLTTIVVNFLLAFLLLMTSDWVVANEFGILQWLPELPLWAFALIGLMLLDLIGAYTAHWAEHRIKLLWMFHIVHHTDTHVDTTTANRHHPGESVIRFAFTMAGVFIVGAPIALVFLYQSVSVVLSQFNHANIKIPKWLDTAISWVFVSPDMHKVHHHYIMPYTDTNYGNIFSIWDRLFGTFAIMKNEDIVYGIDTVPNPEENAKIIPLLKIPFQGHRKATTSE